MKPQFTQLNPFLRAYLTAAFWTFDDKAPPGVDYETTSRPAELYEQLSDDGLVLAVRACRRFQDENAGGLRESGLTAEQAGHDFWLTRNHHGAGFWDRELPANQSKLLTDSAHSFGESDLYWDSDGKLYLTK